MRTGLSNYPPSASFIMKLKPDYSLNLDDYADNGSWARLFFWYKLFLSTTPGDTVYVEASKDGVNWTTFKTRTSTVNSWKVDTVDISPLFSAKGGNDSIVFRFQLKSDNTATASGGWIIDDVYLKVQPVLGVCGDQPDKTGPFKLALSQNTPNPFGKATQIRYQLPDQTRVSLKIYNVAGQLVRTLVSSFQPAGEHAVQWDGRDDRKQTMSAGVYLYRLEAGQQRLTRKLVMLK
jgi:hypothetical protein